MEPMEIEGHGPVEDRLFTFYMQHKKKIRNIIWGVALLLICSSVIVLCNFLVGKHKSQHELISCQQKLRVSADGSAQYKTISEAIDAAPPNNPARTCIMIGGGEYYETLTISPSQANITFIGDGMDKTILKSTLLVIADGFVAMDLTIENKGSPDAAGNIYTVQNMGDESVFYRCKLVGYEKTLVASVKKQFYRDCEIQGSMYFIYGAAIAFFQKCKISSTLSVEEPDNSQIIVAGNNRITNFVESGFVFQMCTFELLPTGFSSVLTRVYLGAPITKNSEIIVMQSYLDSSVAGWNLIQNPDLCTSDGFLGEFNNYGPGAAREPGSSSCTHLLNNQQSLVEQFSLRNWIDGSRWIPGKIPYQLDIL